MTTNDFSFFAQNEDLFWLLPQSNWTIVWTGHNEISTWTNGKTVDEVLVTLRRTLQY